MASNAYAGGAGWGDAEIMQEVLSTAKGQAKFYSTAATESANPGVLETFLAFHGESMHNLEVTFRFLHTRGLYPTPPVNKEQLQQTIQRFRETHSQLHLSEEPSVRRYKTADPSLPPRATEDLEPFDYKNDTLQ
jgi:hypothetical protein